MKQTLYRFYNSDNVLLYVGITKFFDPRMRQHYKNSDWFFESSHAVFEHFQTRMEVEHRETEVIKLEKPLYNIAKNPDKEEAITRIEKLKRERE
jgi:excinuclease UvrABC nuclease subunit